MVIMSLARNLKRYPPYAGFRDIDAQEQDGLGVRSPGSKGESVPASSRGAYKYAMHNNLN